MTRQQHETASKIPTEEQYTNLKWNADSLLGEREIEILL